MSGSTILEIFFFFEKSSRRIKLQSCYQGSSKSCYNVQDLLLSNNLITISLGSILDITIKLKTPILKKWRMYDISHTPFHDLNFFGRIETSFEYENRSNTTMILQKKLESTIHLY